MRKIVLSAITALTLGTVASASGTQLYSDANGQVFTTAGEGRTAIESKETSVFSDTSKLKFSGLTYLGYTYNDFKSGKTSLATDYKSDESNFEIEEATFK